GAGCGTVDSGPAGAARRQGGGGPAEARPLRRPAFGLHVVPESVALPDRAAKRTLRQLLSADVPRRVPALPADPGVAGPGGSTAWHLPRYRDPGTGRAG